MTIGQTILAQYVGYTLAAAGLVILGAATIRSHVRLALGAFGSIAIAAGILTVHASTVAINNAPVAKPEHGGFVCADYAGRIVTGENYAPFCQSVPMEAQRVLVGTGCGGVSSIAIASEEDMLPKCRMVEVHILDTTY